METDVKRRMKEMDELKLKLSTRFMKGIVSKLIAKAVYKKVGCNVDIQLNEITVEAIDGKVYLHLDVDAETTKEDFKKILDNIDL
jgi:hypothetical protein